jgi:Protein of unknown function DUF262
MIVYTVRSKSLLDLAGEMKSQRLVLSPYFQRKLVWRPIHKQEFIETILNGYPFPEVFLARGKIDVEKMEATTCVVDGQQRLTSIKEFLADGFEVKGKKYSEHDVSTKEAFLKYQIAVIELDLDAEDDKLKEIFKRLNRTFYSLSMIEKLATEYAASEFMIVAKVLCNELFPDADQDNEGALDFDPNIPSESIVWAKQQKPTNYQKLISELGIFSTYESQRLVPLMFTLNLMAFALGGNFNRNDLAKKYLEENSQEFTEKDELVINFETVSAFILAINLPLGSYWLNKANIFSLFTLIYSNVGSFEELGAAEIHNRLRVLEQNLPEEYSNAAKEGVNNKKERESRRKILDKSLIPVPPV